MASRYAVFFVTCVAAACHTFSHNLADPKIYAEKGTFPYAHSRAKCHEASLKALESLEYKIADSESERITTEKKLRYSHAADPSIIYGEPKGAKVLVEYLVGYEISVTGDASNCQVKVERLRLWMVRNKQKTIEQDEDRKGNIENHLEEFGDALTLALKSAS